MPQSLHLLSSSSSSSSSSPLSSWCSSSSSEGASSALLSSRSCADAAGAAAEPAEPRLPRDERVVTPTMVGMRGNATGLAIQIFPIRKQVVLHTQKRSGRLSDLFLVAVSDVGSICSANVCRGRPEAQVASRYAATPLKGLLRPHMSMAATSRVRNAVQRRIEAKHHGIFSNVYRNMYGVHEFHFF